MAFGIGGPLAGSLNQASGSPGMDPLAIGSVTFFDEETPEELEIGLAQAWSEHVYIGGSRVAQELGPNPADITWRGKLWAGNVLYRFSQLKQMETAAQPVPLSYIDQSYSVIIKNVKQLYRHRWQGEYEITIFILEDTSGQYKASPPAGIDQQTSGISQAAQDTLEQLQQLDASGTTAINAAFNALFIAIEGAGVLSQLTGGALQALINAAAAAYEATEGYINGLSSGQTGGGAGIGPDVLPPPSTVNGSSQQFILATQLASYATLIVKNLQAGQAPAMIQQQGATGDLFDVATQYYGDPSLAFPLALANSLITPILSSEKVYNIVLPPLSSLSS